MAEVAKVCNNLGTMVDGRVTACVCVALFAEPAVLRAGPSCSIPGPTAIASCLGLPPQSHHECNRKMAWHATAESARPGPLLARPGLHRSLPGGLPE